MKQKIWHMLFKFLSLLLVVSLLIPCIPLTIGAEESSDPVIVVSLGDSFSSGEGIEKFYGQDKPWAEKVKDPDWLAHRSKNSWPSLLEIPKQDGTVSSKMYYYRVMDGVTPSEEYKWYFAAVSGAVTKNINFIDESLPANTYYHKKTVHKKEVYNDEPRTEWLPPQLEIFKEIPAGETVDYVTMTIGGNDVGFTDIVATVATQPAWIYSSVEADLKEVWKTKDTIKRTLKDTYKRVQNAAGSDANIIIAGYPELLDDVNGGGAHVNRSEAQTVNKYVKKFNDEIIKATVDSLSSSMNIHFVDVVDVFDGHEAYTDEAWINGIDIFKKDNDINRKALSSSYSVHPNDKGAIAYAACVNTKIAEIEARGTLRGKVMKASDQATPIANANISITRGNSTVSLQSDSSGHYSRELPVGTYTVNVAADGYVPFNAYATIVGRQTVYMETFLMVQGEEGQVGEACGTITNALTGAGVEGITLDVRKDWNNDRVGEILTTITTDASGRYSVSLPIGNYTLCASKDGFVSTMINIVVQPNMSTNKNASMTPTVSGDNFRIVLTWGENPRDLDSHVVGTLTNGNSFHVYYSHKSQYDGSVEVCNLDHDDTTSYGPETITLNCTNDKPYYYYIYRYAGSGTVASSGAQINVYQGETLVKTFNVPTDLGNGDYWNVFAIVDGQMVIRNTMTSRAETTYANATTFSIRAPKQNAHPAYDDRYPAKEAVAEEATEPAETIVEETTPAIEPAEAVAETIPEVETRKIYLSLGQAGQDYSWKVATQDAEYDVTEEAEDIYSVELPVDTDTIILRGEYEGAQISSVEIALSDIQDNNCMVALACEEGVDEFDIMWGIYDPETQEVTFAVEENLVIAEEVPEETVATEETENTEETESEDAEIIDDAEIPENTDAVS